MVENRLRRFAHPVKGFITELIFRGYKPKLSTCSKNDTSGKVCGKVGDPTYLLPVNGGSWRSVGDKNQVSRELLHQTLLRSQFIGFYET